MADTLGGWLAGWMAGAVDRPTLIRSKAEALGKRIRRLRRGRELTQVQLAARVGVSPTYVCLLEKGRRTNIPLTLAVAFARALNVTLDTLAGGLLEGKADAP